MMNEKLQQAISAARNGQETEAQMLLTQVLKEDPNETQAWFLLSSLVDSESKKIAYLGKVLALEPDHQMAQKVLARLQGEADAVIETEETMAGIDADGDEIPSVPVVVSHDTTDFLAQQKGDTLPEWLIEEENLEITDGVAVAEIEVGRELVSDKDVAIPDWLQDEVPESWSEETSVAELVSGVDELSDTKTGIASTPKPKSKSAVDVAKKKQQSFLTGILYALVALVAVIVVIMIYLAWSTFF